jgi:hypothetical protein
VNGLHQTTTSLYQAISNLAQALARQK